MVKYDKSSIYKICCKDVNIKGEYVGSTTNIQRRKTHHKSCCNNDKNPKNKLPVYSYIRDNGGWENFDFIEVEKFNATDKNHLHTRERYWIELLKSELNCNIPMRTRKEWRTENKERDDETTKKYCEENKEQIADKKKKYYEDNKERFLESAKKYREDNKEKINDKITCHCGEEMNKRSLTRHLKTQKHIAYIQSIQL